MKKYTTAAFKVLATAIVCLVAVTKIFAGTEDPVGEKRKLINKVYALAAGQKVYVKNSFGEVNVVNYPGKEVKVEVTVIARANTDEKAQNILDGIVIADNNGSTISFETKIKSGSNNSGRKRESQSMEINYMLYLPESNPLELQNEFGKTVVGDRSGPTNLTQKFGELSVGTLTNTDEIRVEFGSLNAEKLAGGKTTFKYSEIKVKSFSGVVKSSLEFCSKTKFGLTSDVTDVNISNSYSDIEINLPANFDATYDIHTSFGEFTNGTSYKIKNTGNEDEDSGPQFDKDYSGVSGTGTCNIKIKSSFGKIRLH